MAGLMLDLDRLLAAARLTGAIGGQGAMQGAQKEASLTLSTLPSWYGCCGLWSPGGANDLMSLAIEDEPFLSWLGFVPNDECKQFIKLLTYVGPAGTATNTEATGAAAACDDAPGVEFGTCEILLPDKGRLKRSTPVRDITENNRKPWESYPIATKDGQRITDELMWSMMMAGIVLKQDIKRMLITGNASNANQFSGLQALVNTGYRNMHDGRRCSAMDSTVLDWGSQAFSYKPNGVNGFADYLGAIIRRIKTRAMNSQLGLPGPDDMVLVMPSYLRDGLLDYWTCYTVCPGAQYNETNLNTYEARQYRLTLNGGAFGMGQVFVDGQSVPIIVYDWQTFGSAAPYWTGDIYVLTRAIGGLRVMTGQYIDMTNPANAFAEQIGYPHYRATDNGRFLTYSKTDNECVNATVLIRPNLWLNAPWAQARIMNVAAMTPLVPLSFDPTSSYYAEQYLNPALCPGDYLLASPA